MVRVCLGCQFLTGFTRTIGAFAANRYLLNSVGVDEIPGASEIGLASVTGELSTHFSISEIDMQQDEYRKVAAIAVSLLKSLGGDSQRAVACEFLDRRAERIVRCTKFRCPTRFSWSKYGRPG